MTEQQNAEELDQTEVESTKEESGHASAEKKTEESKEPNGCCGSCS